MKFYCDYKSTINIADNHVLYGRTKYIKVNQYFIKENLDSDFICTPYISNESHLQINFLIKGLNSLILHKIRVKLGMDNICSLAREGVSGIKAGD